MDILYRRTVNELITRYSFHPELRDLYVEGSSDLRVHSWFLSNLTDSRVVVYEINSVDITGNALTSFGAGEGGNKGRLVALASMMETVSDIETTEFICLVDRDFHNFGFPLPNLRFLRLTDFSCLECYSANTNSLGKLFHVYSGKGLTISEIDFLFDLLEYVFMARVSKRQLAPDARWFNNFTEMCEIRTGSLVFDTNAYLQKLASFAKYRFKPDDLKQTISENAEIKPDRLHAINGHDLVQLIVWIARLKNVPHAIAAREPLERAMLLGMEFEEVRKEPLFEELTQWACENNPQAVLD